MSVRFISDVANQERKCIYNHVIPFSKLYFIIVFFWLFSILKFFIFQMNSQQVLFAF